MASLALYLKNLPMALKATEEDEEQCKILLFKCLSVGTTQRMLNMNLFSHLLWCGFRCHR